MNEWYVFKRDEPDTWPLLLNCPLEVYIEHDSGKCALEHCTWNKKENAFDNMNLPTYFTPACEDKCFYRYVSHVPFVTNVAHPVRCSKNRRRCIYYDDGYCMGDNGCKDAKVTTEYMMGYKRFHENIKQLIDKRGQGDLASLEFRKES